MYAPDRTYLEAHRDAIERTVLELMLAKSHDTLNCRVCAELADVARMANARTDELIEAVMAVDALYGSDPNCVTEPDHRTTHDATCGWDGRPDSCAATMTDDGGVVARCRYGAGHDGPHDDLTESELRAIHGDR